jgi:hypothetical protein
MNFKNILQDIEKADPEVYEKLSPRRHVLKSFGAKVAVAAMPFALGSLFKKAYGSTGAASPVITALNFALELEYLEYNFYHEANNTGSNTTTTLIPAADAAGFTTIEAHEKEHIIFLTAAITTLGGVPYTPPNYDATALNPYYIAEGAYDFTAGGTYPVFSNYATFLTIAQTFEDTGVRAYKGQLPNFLGSAGVLTQALQIQSVEARHAAHIRLVRRFAGAIEYPKPWITNNIAPITAVQSVYNGEDNTLQDGINITLLPDAYYNPATVPGTAATEAFDEPIDSATVAAAIAQFML